MENERALKKWVEAGKAFGERFKNGCVMENKNALDFLTEVTLLQTFFESQIVN